MESKQEIHFVPPSIIVTALAAALAALALWGAAEFFSTLKEYRFIGSGTTATNTITVSGEGELFAVPDLATFTVSIQEEAKEVKDAQKVATQKTNDIIAYLRGAGIAEKDIKTTSYNVQPKYEWMEVQCVRYPCPGGKNEMTGYTVSQSIEIKVRDTDKAGEILAAVGTKGAFMVSGLTFTIDDEDKLNADARDKAILDAREKAEVLADQLGVSLVRIVGFSENDGGYTPMYMKREVALMSADAAGGAAPELPMGENKIISRVSVTYEIR